MITPKLQRANNLEKNSYLFKFSKIYNHPAIALWRSVEVKYLSWALKQINFERPILDLGCGEGKVSSIILDQKIDVGFDIDAEETLKAKSTKTYKNFIVGDGCYLPFASGSFGLVFSNSVIEHIPDIKNVLKESARVLKDNGYFIFTVPSENFGDFLFFTDLFNKMGLKRLACWYATKRNIYLNHYNILPEEVWRSKLNDVGLNLIFSRQYLSKTALKIWDFLAFLGFLWRKLQLDKLRIIVNRFPGFDRMRVKVCTGALSRHYLDESDDGGGLLIVAQKKK